MELFESGNWVNQGYYRSFQPAFINRQWKLGDPALLLLLGQADRALGRLDMFSNYVPNVGLFIRMHVTKEAHQSSRIEGTQTTIEEVLMDIEDIPLDKRDDWVEVNNYITALDESIEKLERLPFSSRLIRDTHRQLMQGVRGERKNPGEFRTSQNWIGGASIKDAIFVPPIHTSVNELMSDLEKFAHDETHLFPELLKIALIHYQFETIHPFLDGNGRVGRLMIPLYLIDKKLLKSPIFYISDFFERNRRHYYDNLMRVREQNDLLHWFKFFLVGVIETAENGIKTFDAILQLQKKTEEKVRSLGSKSGNAMIVVNGLYERPITHAEEVSKRTGVAMPTAYTLIRELERLGILVEFTGAQRSRKYIFKEYLDIF